MPEDTIVVRANESLDKDAIDQMLNQGFARGFKASEDRVSKEISYIIITNTDNDRAVLGNITKVKKHVPGRNSEENSDGRIDIYFSSPKEIVAEELYKFVNFIIQIQSDILIGY